MSQQVILLVEDDFLNRRLSKKALMEKNFKVLEAKNAKEAFEFLKKESISLIILDINLGENEMDGIKIGQIIKDQYAVPFIYLTAYENTEIINQAVATTPYSYLIKPFKNVNLITSVEIALKQHDKKHVPKITVRDEEYTLELPIDNINYIESIGNYLMFHTDNKTYKSRSTLRQIIDELSDTTFIQVHRAFIVNKNRIEKFNQKSVWINNVEIPVSKNHLTNFNK